MKYTLSDRLIELGTLYPKFKSFLRPIYYPYLCYLKKKRCEFFNKNALAVLKLFHNALTENNIEYTLAFGTLLGAVREKGFISHDIDIDVAIWAEDWGENIQHCLKKVGFTLRHSFEVDQGLLGREETYEYNGISIDIFYFYPAINNFPYCCDFPCDPEISSRKICMKIKGGILPRRIELPMTRKRVLMDFCDTQFYIPENAHEILCFRYGETYMTPNPNWNIRSFDKHITEWQGKLGIYKSFD